MVTLTAKSLDDVFTEVRLLINDVGVNGSNYRFTDDQVMSRFNTALRELYRYRTDAWIGNFTQGVITNSANPMPTYSAEADLAQDPPTPLPFDDRLFFNAVCFLITGLLELGDDEFTDQGRASQLLASFKQMLAGPGG